MIVPIRATAVAWLVLGGLMASLSYSSQREVEVGDTVWFPPSPGRTRFSKGTVAGLPTDNEYGLFRIERPDAAGGGATYYCGRDGFFMVENSPNLNSAWSANKIAIAARSLGIQCTPDRCLTLENAVGIIGNKDHVQSAAGRIELGSVTLADLMMLEENGFSMCRHLGGRRAKPDDKSRLIVIDGPDGLNVLEDDVFKGVDTPAIAILTPDEWISGQPDSNRTTNALEDWGGELCRQWPQELEMPDLGCLLYRRESSQ